MSEFVPSFESGRNETQRGSEHFSELRSKDLVASQVPPCPEAGVQLTMGLVHSSVLLALQYVVVCPLAHPHPAWPPPRTSVSSSRAFQHLQQGGYCRPAWWPLTCRAGSHPEVTCSLWRKFNRGWGPGSPAEGDGQAQPLSGLFSLMCQTFGGFGHLRWGSSNLLLAARVLTLCFAFGISKSLPTPQDPPPAQPSVSRGLLRVIVLLPGPSFILHPVERTCFHGAPPHSHLEGREKLLRGDSTLRFH